VSLWAHIVDGVLMGVGELPLYARRLDTLELLGPGEVAERAEACGFYPLDVDPGRVTDDPTKRQALIAALAGAQVEGDSRGRFVDAIQDAIGSIKASSWDFIDSYSPIPVPGSQDPGLNWPEGALTLGLLAQRIAILRTEATRTAIQKIKTANALDVLLTVVSRLLDAGTWTPPPDR
jgi:hypothetical protein